MLLLSIKNQLPILAVIVLSLALPHAAQACRVSPHPFALPSSISESAQPVHFRLLAQSFDAMHGDLDTSQQPSEHPSHLHLTPQQDINQGSTNDPSRRRESLKKHAVDSVFGILRLLLE